MQITEHFSFEELTASEIAARRRIHNTHPIELDQNIRRLAETLEDIRVVLGNKPMFITSGYRCRELNDIVGGQKNSAHCHGLAADFICPQFGPPRAVCKAIAESTVDYDQVILEYRSWCHLGLALPGRPSRKQLLTISEAGVVVGV